MKQGLLDKFFNFFEKRVEPFSHRDNYEPPNRFFGYMWFYVRQVKCPFFGMLVFGLLAAIIEATVFSFIGQLVDMLGDYQAGENASLGWAGLIEAHGPTLLFMAVIVAVMRLIVILLDSLMEEQMVVPGFFVLMRWQSHKHIIGQSLSFFQNDLAGRISQKVFQSGMAAGDVMISLLQIIWFIAVYALTTAVVLFSLDWQLGAVIAVWLALFSCVAFYFIPRIRNFAKITAETGSGVTGRMVDAYSNIQTVKLFGAEKNETDGVLDASKIHREAIFKFARTLTLMRVFANLVNGLALVAVGGLVIELWLMGEATLGSVAFVLALALRLRLLLHRMLGNLNNIFRNIGVVQNTMDLVAHPHGLIDEEGATEFTYKEGEVRFNKVSFHYDKEDGVLDDLTLNVMPGEKIGIVGPSGAGKTTMVQLLMRFFDPESGTIEIDGQDISKVTQDSLRQVFSLVQQDTQLFHASVLENIAYGDPDPCMEKVQEAARMAEADGFIETLQDHNGLMGYDAFVGERGVKLSGGQRQRIAIARAFYRNAPILILDEATSQLDSGVEEAIQSNLSRLMEGKTAFVIAHRLSTIASLDRLIVLDQGKIVEQGNHETLSAQDGLYAKLWQKQSFANRL